MKASLLMFAAALGAAGCTCDKSEQAAMSAQPPAATAPSATVAPNPGVPGATTVEPQPSSWPVPSGLLLAILAGKGVGPIRFGATVQTIERLMDLPCEIRTDDACRYIGRAIDFHLKDGVTDEMHIHRVNRVATPDGRTYGVF